MSNEYLQQRDLLYIEKSKALLDTLPGYVTQFYNAKQGSKKELTRHAYLLDLKEFITYLAEIHHEEVKTFPFEIFDKLTIQDIDDYKNYLYRFFKPASVKRKLASISTFYKYLILAGHVENNPASLIDWPKEDKSKRIIYLDADQTQTLLSGIMRNDKQIFYLDEDGNIPESTTKKPKALKGKAVNKYSAYTVGEITKTTKNRREKVKIRNFLITLLFLKTGIRVSELVSINLSDIDFRNTMITITGKGGKTRPVGFGEELAVKSLKDYLSGERKNLSKNNPEETALFLSTNGKRISVRQVETMIKEMVQTYLHEDEFIKHEDFSPHKLRSSAATRLLEQTGDIKAVSDLLGHTSLEPTSKHYAALSQERNARRMQAYGVFEDVTPETEV